MAKADVSEIGNTDDGPHGMARHVAIIMDGNGRWAKARGLPRTAGHKAGVDSVKRAIKAARELGIEYLTLFGFSAENWSRPEEEVGALMSLLRMFLRSEVAGLQREGIRIRFIGDRSLLAFDIVELIDCAERTSEFNMGLTLVVALSYGGRQEIAAAVRSLAADVLAGKLGPESIDETALESRLWTRDLPDPDLIVRTSGEQRISNFLLWQSAYSEFVFLDTLWPDFSSADLEMALRIFRRRERRFGDVVARSIQ